MGLLFIQNVIFSQVGLYQETIVEYEVVLGDGSVVAAR